MQEFEIYVLTVRMQKISKTIALFKQRKFIPFQKFRTKAMGYDCMENY